MQIPEGWEYKERNLLNLGTDRNWSKAINEFRKMEIFSNNTGLWCSISYCFPKDAKFLRFLIDWFVKKGKLPSREEVENESLQGPSTYDTRRHQKGETKRD
jgi:hypothetical protein